MATLWKLGYRLIDQLRFLKNLRNSDIRACTGFYWPVGSGYVEKVECEWEDMRFQYVLTCTKLSEGSFGSGVSMRGTAS